MRDGDLPPDLKVLHQPMEVIQHHNAELRSDGNRSTNQHSVADWLVARPLDALHKLAAYLKASWKVW